MSLLECALQRSRVWGTGHLVLRPLQTDLALDAISVLEVPLMSRATEKKHSPLLGGTWSWA